MMIEGHRLRKDGVDVVIGGVETHGRADIARQVQGFEQVPLKRFVFRGVTIEEMDVDAVIQRFPQVVLVDDLAHTNVPESRHSRRYQDVDELLAAGIHVITTLNIQHIESLFETVERVTAVKVLDRVPDHIIVDADQIINVDLSTEDLLQRLKEGKICSRDRIENALNCFFIPRNLEQLRELTLRELASHIDLRQHRRPAEHSSPSPDQVMVCLSSRGPNSDALLRYASRLAGRLNRNWYALYVQTSKENPAVIDAETRTILTNTLTLAKDLGATVFTYKGEDIVKTILQFAAEYRVGHIVMGRPGGRLSFWRRLRGESSMIDRLITEGEGMTVAVIDPRAGIVQDAQDTVSDADTEKTGAGARPEMESEVGAIDGSRILLWNDPIEKEIAIGQLLTGLCRNEPLEREEVLRALLDRESKGGTFIGEDVIVPHVRVDRIDGARIAVGIGRKGIRDPGSDRTARIMFLLLSPKVPVGEHIAMLSLIGRIARDDRFRENAAAAETVEAVLHSVRSALHRP
jgi:two-component system sensor histidine kinase KdpD